MPLPNTSFAAGRRFGRARSWRAKVAVLRLSRRSVLRAAGGATAMLVLLTPAAALATQVPAAASLKAQLVTGAPNPAVAARSVPLRVENPAQGFIDCECNQHQHARRRKGGDRERIQRPNAIQKPSERLHGRAV